MSLDWDTRGGNAGLDPAPSHILRADSPGPAAPRLPGPVCPLQLGTLSVHPLSKVPPEGPPEQRLR